MKLGDKMEKTKKIILGILKFLCIIMIILDLTIISLKKTSEKYLNEEKINKIINDINVMNLFKDNNGKDLKQLEEIKNKISEAGLPSETVDAFIESKPINNYAKESIKTAINNVLEDKSEKIVTANSLNKLLEKNMSTISQEMKEKNVFNSEYLTIENQQKFIDKIKEKTPYIEQRIDEVSNKINEKLGFNYITKVQTTIKIFKLLYTKILDIILLLFFIIFLTGIIITRKSLYRSIKYIGISFLLSSFVLLGITMMLKLIKRYINSYREYASYIIKDLTISLNKYVIIYLVIGIILIILNTTIYEIKENKNKSQNM